MFKPGVSGNPGGKSKIQAEFEKKCREFVSEKGWKLIEKMTESRDAKIQQWALEQMLNRGFGKPKETIDVTTRDESIPSPDAVAGDILNLIAGESSQGSTATKPS